VAGSSPVAPALSLFLHCPEKLRGFGSLTAEADLHIDELGIGASGCEPILFQMNEPSTAQAKAHIESPEKPFMHDGLSECDTNREMKVSSWLPPVGVSKNQSTQCCCDDAAVQYNGSEFDCSRRDAIHLATRPQSLFSIRPRRSGIPFNIARNFPRP
jgi:hypothetical protein